ncbi:HpyAIV family type II restriction enzyme [Mycoplasmopsis iners]|uniref:HpyAIV family type II restriction enzyme n=1 Tax=Mycoplasmopsis iners TaxID=76630 RepID=UPI000691C740|nr:hypothetical protein [Mycoplasmopsis iners]
MDYQIFERDLKMKLTNGNGPKILLKLIDAPHRYFSLLNPFNFQTKIEQSFLRTQENNYYKYLNNLVDLFFVEKGYEIGENRIVFSKQITLENGEIALQEFKINVSHVYFNNQTKEAFVVWQKKRDDLSTKKADELIADLEVKINRLQEYYSDYQLKTYLWFVDTDLRNNAEYFYQAINVKPNLNTSLFVKYGAELFGDFEQAEYWEEIESFQRKFKSNNYDFFLKAPNLDSDKETYEFMVELSEPQWQKLVSDVPIYKQMRESVFDLTNSESNFFKAYKMREIKATSIDEEDYKNKKILVEQIQK